MYNLFKNNNRLLSLLNKNFNYFEFNLIFFFFKSFNFIQLYKYFKTLESFFNLKNFCIKILNNILKLGVLNIKLIKFFFLIDCLKSIKKKNLINFIFNTPNFFSLFLSFKDSKKKKKEKKLSNLLFISEVYKYYKGSLISFNISNLSWLVKAGLKSEEN